MSKSDHNTYPYFDVLILSVARKEDNSDVDRCAEDDACKKEHDVISCCVLFLSKDSRHTESSGHELNEKRHQTRKKKEAKNKRIREKSQIEKNVRLSNHDRMKRCSGNRKQEQGTSFTLLEQSSVVHFSVVPIRTLLSSTDTYR